MRTLTALVSVVLVAAPLPAQSLDDACAALSQLTVGQWAEYRLTSAEIPGGSATMKFAIVGTEEVDGKRHYWHETAMQGGMGSMVMKILIPGYPYEDGEVARIIVKSGNQPAMEFSTQMMGMMGGGGESPARGAAENCGEARIVGSETITVPAGAFDAMRLVPTEEDAGDIWISVDVPFGIIRFADNAGSSMELLAHGQGATTAITETPRKMP